MTKKEQNDGRSHKSTQLGISLPENTKVSVLSLASAFKNVHDKINSIKLTTNRSKKPVAYVEFETIEDTELACGEGKIEINGVECDIYFARKREMVPKERIALSNNKLYVKNIPKEMTEDELCEILGDCSLSSRKPECPYLFATYKSSEDQIAALVRLAGEKISGNCILEVCPAVERLSQRRFNKK